VCHPRIYEHNKAVLTVLRELGVDQKPVVTALNKIDLLDDKMWLAKLKEDFPQAVCISAKLKDNLEKLLEKIQENFVCRMQRITVFIPHQRMDLVDLFYREGKVEDIKYLQRGIRITTNLPKTIIAKYLKNKELELIDQII
jgi:GTP-binding protein HflX